MSGDPRVRARMVGLLSLWTALLLAAGTWFFVGWVRPHRAVTPRPTVFHVVWRLRDPGTGGNGLPFRLEVRRDGPVTESVRLRAPGAESHVQFEDLVIERGGGRMRVPSSGWCSDPDEPGGPVPAVREWTLPLGPDGRLVLEGRVRLRPSEGEVAAGFLGPEASVFTGRQVFLLPVVAPRDTVRARVEGQALPGHVFLAPGLSSPRVPFEELLDTPLAFGDFVAIEIPSTGLRVHEGRGAAGAARIVEETARLLAPSLPEKALRGMEVIAVAAPPAARHLEGGVARAGVAADLLPDAPHRRARFAERLLTGALLAGPGRLRFGPARDAWLGPGLVGALVQDLRGHPGFEPPVAGETGWERLERLFGVWAAKLGLGLADLTRAPADQRRLLARTQAPLGFRRLEAALPDLRRAVLRASGQAEDEGSLRRFVEETAGAEACALLDALVAPGGVPWLPREKTSWDVPGPSAAAPGPGALRVLASGVTRGLLDGCGCAQGDSGGLPRRAAALLAERAGRAATLFVDAGELFPAQDPLRADALTEEVILTTLRAMRALGLDALAIGASELQLGGAFLRRMAEGAGFPVISCNLEDPRQDGPVFPPHAIIERAGVRYGIVGVTAAPADRVREERMEAALRELRIGEPFAGVQRAVEALRGAADRIVVIGAVSPKVVRRIARELPAVDLVISSDGILVPPPGGGGGYGRDSSGLLGRTLVVYTAPTGHPLEVADVEWGGSGAPAFSVRRRDLPASEPEDPATRALVDDFLRRVGEEPRFRARTTPFFAEGEVENLAGNTWRGSAACSSCHPRQAVQWRETPHARAWERLRREEQHYRAACVACHTTGYGERTGFRIGAPDRGELASVGCEACHGPGGRHIDAGGRGFIRRELPERGCRACHDAVNDPAFERDYADRRRKVRH